MKKMVDSIEEERMNLLIKPKCPRCPNSGELVTVEKDGEELGVLLNYYEYLQVWKPLGWGVKDFVTCPVCKGHGWVEEEFKKEYWKKIMEVNNNG